jgi:hypothetical protein
VSPASRLSLFSLLLPSCRFRTLALMLTSSNMAAVMQPPRPSMDRSASFDQTRRVNSSSFSNSTSPRPSLSQTPSYSSATAASHHRHSFTNPAHANHHSRSSSAASNQQNQIQIQRPASIKSSSSPYQQPYPSHHQSYFPVAPVQVGLAQSQSMYSIPQQHQAWATAALPVSAFHASPFQQAYATAGGANQVFHPGFQQSQAEFAAWAGEYQQMMAQSQGRYGGIGQGQGQGMFTGQKEYIHDDRDRARSVSSPQPTPTTSYERSQSPPQTQQAQTKPPVQAFHPYKRSQAQSGPGRRPSRENIAIASVTSSGGMTRSSSQPIISRPPPPVETTHSRNVSNDSVTPPPRLVGRTSESSERERPSPAVQSQAPAQVSTKTYANAATGITPATPANATTSKATPLHTGPISNAAANTPPAPRPSPLSNTVTTPVEPEKKGFKGRFRKALGGDSKRSTTPVATISTPALTPASTPSSTPAQASMTRTAPSPSTSMSSTRVGTPQHYSHDVPLNPPSAPFAVSNQGAMGSDVSLANTERTTTTLTGGPGEGKEKKRSMFRMKNMSTDNISLSSTVSSASMMIRRMGSIGKLARRNSLVSPFC